MPSINIDLDFFTHLKAVRLTNTLGPDSTGNLIRLWCHVGKHYPDNGGSTDWAADEVEAAAGWMGEKGALIDCLMRLKLLHQWEDGYRVHDWEDHAGHLKRYREKAKAAAGARWNRKNYATSNAPGMPQAMLNCSPSNAPSNANTIQDKKERERDIAREPPEIPERLMTLAENVLGMTPVGQLRLLAMDGHPMDWIEMAVKETGFRGINQGKQAVNYTRRILQEWSKNGGPPNEKPKGGHGQSKRPSGGGGGSSGKFAGLDPWADDGGGGAGKAV